MPRRAEHKQGTRLSVQTHGKSHLWDRDLGPGAYLLPGPPGRTRSLQKHPEKRHCQNGGSKGGAVGRGKSQHPLQHPADHYGHPARGTVGLPTERLKPGRAKNLAKNLTRGAGAKDCS